MTERRRAETKNAKTPEKVRFCCPVCGVMIAELPHTRFAGVMYCRNLHRIVLREPALPLLREAV